MYKVLIAFLDKEDDYYRYEAGDTYPREGYEPNEDRVNMLLGSQNALQRPLIQRIRISKKTKKEGEE